MQVVYNGAMKDEFGRSMGHSVWGIGTEGSDTLDASTWSGVSGAAVVAGSGNDRVIGTAGADLIVGGLGADTLTGGLGSDRFAYNTVTQGTGGTGGLGGTGGDVITDFNTSSNSIHADVLDLSDLFQLAPGDSLTGDAQHDAQTLMAGSYIDLVRVNSGKDLQVWVDRDGGDVMGQLVTLQDIGTGLGTYFTVSNETSEQLLQRLLTEGRMQVTHA
jgi:Ca2+-binding RTX toxin-like protein